MNLKKKRNQKPEFREVPLIIAKKSSSLLSQEQALSKKSLFLTQPSYKTPQIDSESVRLTVTSPPFLDIVNYVSDNWLRHWFLGIDPKSISITQYKNIEDWTRFIHLTLKELTRITCRNGHIAFEVGEIRGGAIQLENHVITAAQNLPIEVMGVVINKQIFTKTANCWGIANNKKGTNSNRIILFRKK